MAKLTKEEQKVMQALHEELGYVKLPQQNASDFHQQEAFADKFKRKILENPLVPIGLSITTFALVYGIMQMRTGNKEMSQKMMRLRVVAQGSTVFALLGGVLWSGMKTKAPAHPK